MESEQQDLFNNVRSTSKKAYAEISWTGKKGTIKQRILVIIRLNPGITRLEISRRFGFTINSTCGRIKELLDSGDVYEKGTKIDLVTKKGGLMLYGKQEEKSHGL